MTLTPSSYYLLINRPGGSQVRFPNVTQDQYDQAVASRQFRLGNVTEDLEGCDVELIPVYPTPAA